MGNHGSNSPNSGTDEKTPSRIIEDQSEFSDFISYHQKEDLFMESQQSKNILTNSLSPPSPQQLPKSQIFHESRHTFLPYSKQIMVRKKISKHPKNSIRFLVRLALKYLKQNQDSYPPEIFQLVKEKCNQLRKWKSQDRKNIFLMKHLQLLLNDQDTFSEQGVRLNKKVFSKVLVTQSLGQIQDRTSQINVRKREYLRVCKIYSLRCKNQQLILRNQSK